MGEMVEFPSNGHTSGGYLAVPSSGRGPGVIVIQEWWGLVGHIKDVCDRFAEAGFVALAPDLFHGKSAELNEPDRAGKLLMELELDGAARDILGAARWLVDSGRIGGDQVGIIGFCMGGALAVYAASLSDVFAATVAFYPGFGVTEKARPDVSHIRGGVQGHFAERDHSYSREQVDDLERRLRDAGVDTEFHWYSDAGHAFFNEDRPEVYNAAAAEEAWERTISFLRKRLAATPAPV